MENEIVKTPVLNIDLEVIAPIGTELTDEVIQDLANDGIDTIETHIGTLHIRYTPDFLYLHITK